MIEVKKLVKTFDGFTALDSATLTVPRGAVYGLVGPNGAGKSTLLRHITGVYRQDSGQVLVNGVPVFENRHAKERIVSIPDDWFYYNQSTIREMAKLYAGMYPQFEGGRFEKLRELFHLPEKKPIRRMSKGMQRQAAFWITMSCMPEYLVLDEPVDGLDPVMRRQVCQVLLESLRMDGCLKIGFVRVSQVLSAVVILTVTVLHAMGRGGRKAAIQRVLIFVLCAGGVGGIEWALDKTPISNLLLYAVMAAFCAAMYVNGRRKTA